MKPNLLPKLINDPLGDPGMMVEFLQERRALLFDLGDLSAISNKEIFDLLDKLDHENILKVFPHKLFCDTKIPNRCLTHDNKNVYYFDDRHLASKGSEILVNEIYLYINKLI